MNLLLILLTKYAINIVSNCPLSLYLHSHRLMQRSDYFFVQRTEAVKELTTDQSSEIKGHKWDIYIISRTTKVRGPSRKRVRGWEDQSETVFQIG